MANPILVTGAAGRVGAAGQTVTELPVILHPRDAKKVSVREKE
jgi:hypothetical protein